MFTIDSDVEFPDEEDWQHAKTSPSSSACDGTRDQLTAPVRQERTEGATSASDPCITEPMQTGHTNCTISEPDAGVTNRIEKQGIRISRLAAFAILGEVSNASVGLFCVLSKSLRRSAAAHSM
jgi:hypothetical protein